MLGRGAMGVVYEGFDPALNRSVAVKTILKSVVTDEETAAAYSARFAREAKAAGRLNHPHIVQVYDFGEQDDVAYLAMEFIQGRELRSCFEARDRFDAAETVRIMGELLDALEFAHQAGVIHRDVKPANIMLDEQRRVKLADFGVARIQDGTDYTKSGAMVGTPAFMSPEQITGGRLDRRTDVFSAGIVLYQLLTGELPFKGEGAWTVAKQIMQDEPPRPSTVATRVTPAFDQIVNRALAKKPDHRFASAKEFSSALQRALAGDSAAGDQRGSDAEIEFWRSIQNSSDPAEFEIYLKEFPQGVYADLARVKLSKLPRLAAGETVAPAAAHPPARESVELAKLAEETARLEAALAQREAEQRKREAEAEAKRIAEAKARAEADAKREAEMVKREAEAKARTAAEEKARLEAIEKAKKDAQAELAKKEAEYLKREADARAKAEAEAKARRDVEEKARKDAEARAKAEAEDKARHEATARAEAEVRKRMEVEEYARRQAEIQRRESELKKLAAQVPRAKTPALPIAIAFAVVVSAAIGAWYWTTSSDESRLATLTAALDAGTKATRELDLARLRQEELRKQVEVAHLAEDEARARGDQAKLKELQEQTKKAEAEAAKQADLVKQREAEVKKAEDATKVADAKKQTDAAKAAQKTAQEKLAQEKAAQEKAAAEKIVEDKAAAEKIAADKIAAEKAAIAKATSQRPAATRVPAASTRMPSVGDRWVYEAREANNPDKKYEVVVDVLSAGPSGIRDRFRSPSGTVELTHQAGAVLDGVAPGIVSFAPYLGAVQELRGGESWPRLELRNVPCRGNLAGRDFCSASARVVGKEKVSVRAGSFESWKVTVDYIVSGGATSISGQYSYWYAEDAKRIVKYQSRLRVGFEPNMDMELVSYIPASEQAVAQRSAAAKPPTVTAIFPSVGDRWVYEAHNAQRLDDKFQVVVDVLAVSPSSVREAFKAEGRTAELTHQATPILDGVAQGILSFLPYARAFQELRGGENWVGIEMGNVRCDSGGMNNPSCSASAHVAGKEKISVRAGSFDAWKIIVDLRLSNASVRTTGQFLFWYAEDAKRIVKYQSRVRSAQWLHPDMDMELVSYTPAGSK